MVDHETSSLSKYVNQYLIVSPFLDTVLVLFIMRTLTSRACEEEFVLNISSAVLLGEPINTYFLTFKEVEKQVFQWYKKK